MASQTRSVDNTVSAQWTNPDNAFTENDLCTTAVSDGNQNVYNVIGTPFTIPSGATIDGIEVKTVRATDENDYYEIELQDKVPAWKLKTGTPYLATCAAGTPETLGGAADLWAGSWDATHINSSSFQIRLTYQKVAKANTPSVDHIEITIHYSEHIIHYVELDDTIQVADEISKPTSFKKLLEETIQLADEISKATSYGVTLEDSIGAASEISAPATLKKLLEDEVELSDALDKLVDFKKSLDDTIQVSSELGIYVETGVIKVLLEDTINVLSTLSKTSDFYLTKEDEIQVSDLLEKVVTFKKTLLDTIRLAAALQSISSFCVTLEDTVKVAETLLKSTAFNVSLSDAIIVGDEIIIGPWVGTVVILNLLTRGLSLVPLSHELKLEIKKRGLELTSKKRDVELDIV